LDFAVIRQFVNDIQQFPVLSRALVAAVLVGFVCSSLSVYVVLKRLAFIGQGIAHAALGGIAIGVLLFAAGPMVGGGFRQFGVDVTTAIFCVLVAWMIGWASGKRVISEDTAIGVFFVAAMALGVLLIALRRQYTAQLFTFLFGSVLAVTGVDIIVVLILFVVILTTIVILYRQLFLYCLDSELAAMAGMPVRLIHYGLLTALALTVVMSMKIVGVLLVTGFLVIPGATARLLTYRFGGMFLLANIVGLLAVLGGLMVSDAAGDVPSGAAIVLCLFVMFLLAAGISALRQQLLPGRQLTSVTTAAVVLCYVVLLGVISSQLYVRTADTEQDASQLSSQVAEQAVLTARLQMLASAVRDNRLDQLAEKLDNDPAYAEELTWAIESADMTKHVKAALLAAIAAGDFGDVTTNAEVITWATHHASAQN